MIAKEFGQRLYDELEEEAHKQATLDHRVQDLRKGLERVMDDSDRRRARRRAPPRR